MLFVRKYRRKTIDEAFERARKIPRQEALKRSKDKTHLKEKLHL